MHELAVTESILAITLKHTPPGQRVTAINVVIGQLSSIVDDSVQFYWDIASADTAAAGARLNFRRLPAELLCLSCGARFGLGMPAEDGFACPGCKSEVVKVVQGEEFYVEDIEVEG